jgi:hypothetical protein
VYLIKKYFAAITGIIVFIFYLISLAPSVIQIDSGELSAVQALPGIAHPTGYPLFTITGYLFSLLPFPFTKIYLLNILSAIWCALGVTIFIATSELILSNIKVLSNRRKEEAKKISKKAKKNKQLKNIGHEKKEENIPETNKIIASIAGGLILAFSRTYWFQSTSVEVYSLHLFLVLSIIFFLLKGYLYNGDPLKFSYKNPWLIFAFLLALGFSNHMTTLLIIPGTAFLFFTKYGVNKKSFRQIGLMLLVFIPVLILIYLYLPFRASNNPLLNWGNPIDYERILRHISGKQYQVWLFSSTAAAKKQLTYFVNNLINEFSLNIFIITAGIIISYLNRKFFLFFLITFLSTVLYSINYDINDIDSYFLLAFISLSFFGVFGVLKIISLFKIEKRKYLIPAVLIALFIFAEIFSNFNKVSQRNVFTFEDYTKELINSTEKNSIILSYQWDYFISPSYYFQNIENFRKDVIIIDKELLRRSWYYHQLNNSYPGLLKKSESDVNMFLEALAPFEKGENYNAALLENLFRKILTGIISGNIDSKNIYIAPEIFENEMQKGELVLPTGYTLVPDLFLFKIIKGNDYEPAVNPDFKIRFPQTRNHYINMIENFTGTMLARRAIYELQFDKIDRAKIYVNKIRKELQGYKLPPVLRNIESN